MSNPELRDGKQPQDEPTLEEILALAASRIDSALGKTNVGYISSGMVKELRKVLLELREDIAAGKRIAGEREAEVQDPKPRRNMWWLPHRSEVGSETQVPEPEVDRWWLSHQSDR